MVDDAPDKSLIYEAAGGLALLDERLCTAVAKLFDQVQGCCCLMIDIVEASDEVVVVHFDQFGDFGD